MHPAPAGACLPLTRRRAQTISHGGRGLYQGIPDRFEAVRYHSLAVTRLPASLVPLAWAPDGTLMALQHRRKPWWGVQFHPGSICTQYGARLLRNFWELTRQRKAARPRQDTWGSFMSANGTLPQSGAGWSVHARCLDVFHDPERVFQWLFADRRPSFWLDSSLSGPVIARFSFMGDASGPDSESLSYHSASRSLRTERQAGTETRQQSIFEYLGERMGAGAPRVEEPLPFDFTGGFVGYFGYELKQELEGEAAHASSSPDAAGLFVDRFLAFDHAEAQTWLVWLVREGQADPHTAWVGALSQLLNPDAAPSGAAPDASKTDGPPTDLAACGAAAQGLQSLRWRIPLARHRELIERCQHQILMGESYEICLTNQLIGTGAVAPLQIYSSLRERSAAPYAAYLTLPGVRVLSASPELFLAVRTDRSVESKPIKGTAPRGGTPEADARIKADLLADEKTRSENLMIVDLLRNDLNRSCETHSVHVPVLFGIETFASGHQMVSTVRGTLKAGRSAIDALATAFPGGSMTGAPKVRTMRIIDELEGAARGIYSGSLGYLSLNGAARLNIVIRTLVVQEDAISIGAGGAIVALSDPDAEVQEIILKARALWDTLRACGASLDDADLQGSKDRGASRDA